MVDFQIQASNTSLFFKTLLILKKKYHLSWYENGTFLQMTTPILAYTMLLGGGTPLNNPLKDFCALLSKSRQRF